jgi:hypothetical protein
MNLEFEEDDQSGHLTAIGDKGTYWIHEIEPNVVHLVIMDSDYAGPNVKELGNDFRSIDDAELAADRYDNT